MRCPGLDLRETPSCVSSDKPVPVLANGTDRAALGMSVRGPMKKVRVRRNIFVPA